MKLLRMYLSVSRPGSLAAILLGVCSGVLAAALIAVLNEAIGAEPGARWGYAWAIGGLCVLRLASGIGAHLVLVRISQRAVMNMRMTLCRSVISSPLATTERLGAGRLNACFGDDVQLVAFAVVNIPYFFVNLVIIAGSLAYMGWMSMAALGGLSALLLLGAASYMLPVAIANRRLVHARDAQDELFSLFRDVIHGVKELKLYSTRRARVIEDRFATAADLVRKRNVEGIGLYASAANWNRMLFFVYVGALILAWPLITDLPPAALAGHVVLLLYIMAPLEAIMNALPHIARAEVALGRAARLQADLEPEPSLASIWPSESWRSIELRGVRLGYQAEDGFELGPIDLRFQRGEVVYLVGSNGSGKTTLVKLLTGLYLPDHGGILVDGNEITAEERPIYRELFAALFADFHVFDEFEAIRGRASSTRVADLLRRFDLDGLPAISDGTVDASRISSGQLKRAALIEALLLDRSFYVFDEWASYQDPRFRNVFYEEVVPSLAAEGKAVLVVTHDDRFLSLADRIVRLESGRQVQTNAPPRDTTGRSLAAIGERP
ncbi:MAG: cyclic peptide export ABC transporter [Planctomycetota bacterium]